MYLRGIETAHRQLFLKQRRIVPNVPKRNRDALALKSLFLLVGVVPNVPKRNKARLIESVILKLRS